MISRLVAMAMAGGMLLLLSKPTPAQQQSTTLRTFTVTMPAGVTQRGSFALSPDGRRLAFVASRARGPSSIWVGPLESTAAAEPLSGTNGADSIFWSPDSRQIGFVVDGRLKTISAAGGDVRTLCEAPSIRGATWGQHGDIVIALGARDPLSRVRATGGTPVPVTVMDEARQDNTHRGPYFLPDGRRFLFTALGSRRELSGLFIGSLDSTASVRVPARIPAALYSPPGYLVFQRQGRVMAQRFDADRLEIRGEPLPITEQLPHSEQTGPIRISVSQTGVLAYQGGGGSPTSELVWFDRTGKRLGVVGPQAVYRSDLRLSRDGTRVALGRVDVQTDTANIVLIDTKTGAVSHLTSDAHTAGSSVWSPDGSRVIFTSRREPAFADIYQRASDGSQETLLLQTGATKHPTHWSVDGRFVVFHTANVNTAWDLWVLPMTDGGKAFPYLHSKYNEWLGQISPDGRWMAYMSDESGTPEIYVNSFPVPGQKKQISAGGGAAPQWRHDGQELFYMRPDDESIMAVTLTAGVSREAAPLFQMRLPARPTGYENGFAISPDGQRFLVNTLVGERQEIPITVVVGWPSDLLQP